MKAILATSMNGVIGIGNELPWRLKDDMKFFIEYTKGKTVIMGRKTWDSLPRKPLPNRRNVVLTKKPYLIKGADIITSIEELNSPEFKDAVIIGGAELYNQVFKFGLIDEFALTMVGVHIEDENAVKVDIPMSILKQYSVIEKSFSVHMKNEVNDHGFTYAEYKL